VVEYLRLCGVERHINIVPNTVDLSDFAPENVDPAEINALKKRLGITAGDTVLGFVGRLGHEKSLDVLINYFCDSFFGDKQFKLFVIGDGPERAALEKQIERRGAGGQVVLLGRVEHKNLPPYYHAFDLFATASLSEMNSISMLEATASGLFVVQRLDVYTRDQIKSGVNGDVFETCGEFEKLVRRQDALTAEERAARKRAVSAYACRYGIREFTEGILNVYRRAIHRFKP
jgi:1,2-diacylglycerol 3-alpha-glucosyltransferase